MRDFLSIDFVQLNISIVNIRKMVVYLVHYFQKYRATYYFYNNFHDLFFDILPYQMTTDYFRNHTDFSK